MGRKKKHPIWDQFEEADGIFKCKLCMEEFKEKPTIAKLKKHLEDIKDDGTRICNPVATDSINETEGEKMGPSKRRRIQAEANEADNRRSTSPQNSSSNHLEELVPDGETRQPDFEGAEQGTEQPTSFDDCDEDVDSDDEIRAGDLLTRKLVGSRIRKVMEDVFSDLRKDNVLRVGIYGMGGVGKTELAKHIHNQLLRENSDCNNVYWIGVSPHFTIHKLQHDIAKAAKIDLSDEDDENKRAAILFRTLVQKKNFVLFLDDVWSYIPLDNVGVPISSNACQLILTSRSKDICRMMGCQRRREVNCLKGQEDWELFIKILGHDISAPIIEVAKSILKECEGLPLMIISMAINMREVHNLYQWRDTLQNLKDPQWRQLDKQVFEKLKLSYDYLDDPTLQRCFLYCALSDGIDDDQLPLHLIVEGIIEKKSSRRADIDEVQGMLDKLRKSCLLEGPFGHDAYRMHNLVRKMAIQILKEISGGGKQLNFAPQDKCWAVDTARVFSLAENDIEEIPHVYSTLIFYRNNGLKWIEFIEHLQGLKVLNLSHTEIETLHVGYLKNLRALFLKKCSKLLEVQSLGELGLLEVLDLSDCWKIIDVPEGVEELSNLWYLNLCGTRVTDFGDWKFTNLRLQFLAFGCDLGGIGIKAEGLADLRQLETLVGWFVDFGELRNYFHLLRERQQHLSKYSLSAGPEPCGTYQPHCQEVFLSRCAINKQLYLLDEPHRLEIDEVSIEDGCGLCLKNGIHLDSLEIRACEEMKYLFSVSSSPSVLQNLDNVNVVECSNLHSLFGREDDDHDVATPPPPAIPDATSFSHLSCFEIASCGSIKKLFPAVLLPNLQNLQVLSIYDCSQMEEIIAAEETRTEDFHSTFSLPNLWFLHLEKLPELKSISTYQIKCESLKQFRISGCSKLESIPICSPVVPFVSPFLSDSE